MGLWRGATTEIQWGVSGEFKRVAAHIFEASKRENAGQASPALLTAVLKVLDGDVDDLDEAGASKVDALFNQEMVYPTTQNDVVLGAIEGIRGRRLVELIKGIRN